MEVMGVFAAAAVVEAADVEVRDAPLERLSMAVVQSANRAMGGASGEDATCA
jgi:hypothetical protein